MNLKHLSDECLLSDTERAVQAERDALTVVLYHLLEVERRRLFSSLKYPSLFEYAVSKLKYSRHEAYDRISAMRLLKELPEIEGKINSGAVNLTTLCQAKTFFNQERKENNHYGKREKLALISQLENKSSREVQRVIYSLSSNPQQMAERVKSISDQLTEYKFTADADLHEKILKLKGLLAHQSSNISTAELMEKLCEIALKKLDPEVQKIRAPGKCKDPRALPTSLKKTIWQRDKGKCANCGSTYALQFDHIKPVAFGGESATQNLRLLCRSCNQHAAIQALGVEKMNKYIG